MTAPRPVVLCILDGWGLTPTREGNAVAQADLPNYRALLRDCPQATLVTFGPDVGLPRGQMGNSEVGHTNIGAGRVVTMDLGQIDLAIEDGSFARNPALLDFAKKVTAAKGRAHLVGLISDGGVHGHWRHVVAAAQVLAEAGLEVLIHAITDGRDTPPDSGADFLAQLQAELPAKARVVTVTGRYFAMDRDHRWQRIQAAYDAMVRGRGVHRADSAAEALATAADRGETDEFVTATVLGDYAGARDGDGLFCLNFRSDRARQILAAIGEPGFEEFDTGARPHWSALLGMVEYSDRHNRYMATVFPRRDLKNTLGEWVSSHGLTQFRLAETEKYPHVTFFLNGGIETPWPGEERLMPHSPKVATYDLQPEMSAPQVGDALVAAIGRGYDLIVVNFANADMVGHTGILAAAIAACEAVDLQLGRALAALRQVGGAMLLLADHGNCEVMIDPATGGPHTAHTTNPVPVVLMGGPEGARLIDGRLADVAPTLLQLMGLPQPPEMTGHSLIAQ